jgi:hypothetical protein
MQKFLTSVEWRYVIPPANSSRVVIMQRLDGAFKGNTVGGPGHYYTSVEVLLDGTQWVHVPGSATGGHPSFEEAFRVASEQWQQRTPSSLRG